MNMTPEQGVISARWVKGHAVAIGDVICGHDGVDNHGVGPAVAGDLVGLYRITAWKNEEMISARDAEIDVIWHRRGHYDFDHVFIENDADVLVQTDLLWSDVGWEMT